MSIDYDALLLGATNVKPNKPAEKTSDVDESVSVTEPVVEKLDEHENEEAKESEKESDRAKDARRLASGVKFKPSSPSDKINDVKQRRKRTSVKSQSGADALDVCFLKDFPRSLMNEVRRIFPDARNNTDALSAFVIVNTGVHMYVNDTVQELVDEYTKEDPMMSVDDRLKFVEKQNRDLIKLVSELELGLSYMIYDRLGYRTQNANDVRSVDMLESNKAGSVKDIVERLREQAEQMRKQDSIKNGRPIR